MTKIRRVILWITLLFIAMLIVMSIFSAFLPKGNSTSWPTAGEFFNSTPLIVFWVILAGLFAIGFVMFTRLITKPGLLAIHLGCLFILAGAMWGSETMHKIRKMPRLRGTIELREGETDDLGLPFQIKLIKTWRENYSTSQQWEFGYFHPATNPKTGKTVQAGVPLDLRSDKWQIITETGLSIRVLKFHPRMQIAVPDSVAIVKHDGLQLDALEAIIGENSAYTYVDPRNNMKNTIHMRIVRVFKNYDPVTKAESAESTESIDNPDVINPAAEVALTDSYGRQANITVMLNNDNDSENYFVGRFPFRLVYRRKLESDDPLLPAAVDLEIDFQGLHRSISLRTEAGRQEALAQISEIFPGIDAPGQTFILSLQRATPSPIVKDWFSQLQIIVDGKAVAEKVIEVNDPLHYGGHHFYQANWRQDILGQEYSGISVVDDTGLDTTLAGFVMLMGGVLWQMGILPIWSAIRRSKRWS